MGRYIMEQKKFGQCKFDRQYFPVLEKFEENGRRFYKVHNGLYLPSVTTVLDYHKSEGLKDWEKRVGPEKAAKEREAAAWRGTLLHTTIDRYTNNILLPILKPHAKLFFDQVKGVVDDHIDLICANELPLHSIYHGVAGTCDLIANYDGRLSVIDFKTSKNYKKEDWITNYFEQASMYALLFNNTSYASYSVGRGIIIDQIVIIIAVEHGGTPQVFVKTGMNCIVEHVVNFQSKLRQFTIRK